jgi:hypothetical protein
MYKHKSLILGILVLFGAQSAQALTERAAWVAGTAVSTAATFMSSNYYKKTAIFGLSELLAVKLFLSYTPQNRYNWAIKNLDSAKLDLLFVATMDSDCLPALLQDAGCESSELPLVDAFLRLQHYDKQLVYIQQELQAALSDLDASSELAAKINDLIRAIKPHLARVRANEAFIKNQKNWLDQWRLHQERLLAKEKLDHYNHLQTHIVWNVRNY